MDARTGCGVSVPGDVPRNPWCPGASRQWRLPKEDGDAVPSIREPFCHTVSLKARWSSLASMVKCLCYASNPSLLL